MDHPRLQPAIDRLKGMARFVQRDGVGIDVEFDVAKDEEGNSTVTVAGGDEYGLEYHEQAGQPAPDALSVDESPFYYAWSEKSGEWARKNNKKIVLYGSLGAMAATASFAGVRYALRHKKDK